MTPRTVRSGKGDQDRCTTVPATLTPWLQNHLASVKTLHQQDAALGHGEVYLPHALARKYSNTAKEWGWQYVFPPRNLSVGPRSGVTRRHHVDPSVINKAIKVAVRRVGLTKTIKLANYTPFALTPPSQKTSVTDTSSGMLSTDLGEPQ